MFSTGWPGPARARRPSRSPPARSPSRPAADRAQSAKLDAVALADAMKGQLAAQTRLDAAFGPLGSWITVPPVVVTAAGREPAEARTSWHPGACAGVHVVAGRCLAGPDDALVATRTLNALRLHLGDRLRIALDGPPDPGGAAAARDEVTIVGAYDVTSAQPQVWGSRPPAQYQSPPVGPAELDEILLDRGRIARAARAGGETSTTAFRLLRPGLPSAAAVDAAGAQAASAVEDLTQQESAAVNGAPRGTTRVHREQQPAGLPRRARAGAPGGPDGDVRRHRRVGAPRLVRVVPRRAGRHEERGGELALAKLRGLVRPAARVRARRDRRGVRGGRAARAARRLLVDRWLVVAVPLPRSAPPSTRRSCSPDRGLRGGLVAAAIALRRVVHGTGARPAERSGGTRQRWRGRGGVERRRSPSRWWACTSSGAGRTTPWPRVTPGLLALGPACSRSGSSRSRRAQASAVPARAGGLVPRGPQRRPPARRPRLVVLLTVATTLASSR